MQSIRITNQKDFTAKLFTLDTFDTLLLDSAIFHVYSDFVIDGRVNQAYFDNEEEAAGAIRLSWARFRPVCFQIIKGSKKPVGFKLVFLMDQDFCKSLERQENLSLARLSVNNLFFNVRYEAGVIMCTTGVSITSFSLDKTAEHSFDKYICTFLNEKEIEYEIC